jgi:hypothetical protein
MKKAQRNSSAYVKKLLEKVQIPRNQISAISGLSNTYIRDLESGNIANVGRDKLISFSVALNLDLSETDNLLTIFDRAKLTSEDISFFLEASDRRKISTALLPVRGSFALSLMHLSAERIPGPHVLVSSIPSVSLRAEGHGLHINRHILNNHPLRKLLIEAIARERKHAMALNLARYTVEQYICKHCLEDYVNQCEDQIEKKWRVKHIENILWYTRNFENLKFFAIDRCPVFVFALKAPAKSTKENERLIITRFPPHGFGKTDPKMLSGFATKNNVIIQNFKQEIEFLRETAAKEYVDRKKMENYLQDLISPYIKT